MKKKFLVIGIVIGLMALIGILAPNAEAIITYDLDKILSGDGVETPVPSFGTISFETVADQNADGFSDVKLTIDLVDTSSGDPHKVNAVYWNYDDAKFNSDIHDFNNYPPESPNAYGVEEDENNLEADGFTGGMFDLKMPDPPPGSMEFEPYSTFITLSGVNLTENDFDFPIAGDVYASVHIGNYGGAPGTGGEDSIWSGGNPTNGNGVPEPFTTTMLLLSAGYIGLLGLRRRFKK